MAVYANTLTTAVSTYDGQTEDLSLTECCIHLLLADKIFPQHEVSIMNSLLLFRPCVCECNGI